MPMNIYSDTTGPTLDFAIHWDTAQVLDNGDPDPAYVEWYSFPAADLANKPVGLTNAQYKAAYATQCGQEARALAKLVRQARNKAQRKATDLSAPVADNS